MKFYDYRWDTGNTDLYYFLTGNALNGICRDFSCDNFDNVCVPRDHVLFIKVTDDHRMRHQYLLQ